MPKTYRQIRKILLKHGFIELSRRGKGGHVMFYNPTNKRKVTLPSHSGDVGLGLEKAIWKQAGLEGENI
ncbi:type II toxin-antitoxin system HicA family toxin [Macrococcus capreoli]